MLPALLETVSSLDISKLDEQLRKYAGNQKLQNLAKYGLRGELLLPVPYILENKPTLLGYYRLLLGFSQKEFYGRGGFGIFSGLELKGKLNTRNSALLPDLCSSLIESSWILFNSLPNVSKEILHALTLITFGGQLRGSYNTSLGQSATKSVFQMIRKIVENNLIEEDNVSLTIRNAAGRIVRIEFSPDPDIAIREKLGSGKFNNRIAIEIKGGKDISNIHNRLGEAEKSHQKARELGFRQFWTMVNVSHLDFSLAQRESPTTTAFFEISKLTDNLSPEYKTFMELLVSEIGLED